MVIEYYSSILAILKKGGGGEGGKFKFSRYIEGALPPKNLIKKLDYLNHHDHCHLMGHILCENKNYNYTAFFK